jgi:hypothetical protein
MILFINQPMTSKIITQVPIDSAASRHDKLTRRFVIFIEDPTILDSTGSLNQIAEQELIEVVGNPHPEMSGFVTTYAPSANVWAIEGAKIVEIARPESDK